MFSKPKPGQDTAGKASSAGNNTTAKVTQRLPTSILPVHELEDVTSDYVDAKELVSKEDEKFFSSRSPATFFELRLYVKKLLQHAANGEKDQVEEMLIQNPALLLEKATVTDYSGRTHFQRTVYQIVLGALDGNVQHTNGNKVVSNGMIEMIEGYFKKLPNKTPEEIEKIRQEQYNGQFPDGQQEKEEKRVVADSVALNTVMGIILSSNEADCKATNNLEDAIRTIIRKAKDANGNPTQRALELDRLTQLIVKAETEEKFNQAFAEFENYLQKNGLVKNVSFNFDILKAIYRFRNHLEPKDVFTTGKHFNHQLHKEAIEIYEANYRAFGGTIQVDVCWQKVKGYIERFVPACDCHVVVQGADLILEDRQFPERQVAHAYDGFFFPLDANEHWELGYNYSCNPSGGVANTYWAEGGWDHLKAYLDQKQRLGLVLMQASQQQSLADKKPAAKNS